LLPFERNKLPPGVHTKCPPSQVINYQERNRKSCLYPSVLKVDRRVQSADWSEHRTWRPRPSICDL